MNGDVHVFENAASLAEGAAERICAVLQEEVRTAGAASLVVSGGTTPRGVYEVMGGSAYRDRIPWSSVHLFWGDERCVRPDAPESNYRMVRDALLDRLEVPDGQIHRIRAEKPAPEAALLYESEIRDTLGVQPGIIPRFTLVLLGLGVDGHTASLFPGTSALGEESRLVVAVHVPKLNTTRITMTLPLLRSAVHVIFLVAGASKSTILREVLENESPVYPAQLIQPTSGRLLWLVDREAAGDLAK